MKNYGKIVIMADTIEQAQAELDTIKSLVSMGITSASGEVEITEEIVVEMPRATECGCACRGGNCMCPCCCDDEEDLNEPVELDGKMVSRFIAEIMGL